MDNIRKKIGLLWEVKSKSEYETLLLEIFSDLEETLNLSHNDLRLVRDVLSHKKSYEMWGIDELIENRQTLSRDLCHD